MANGENGISRRHLLKTGTGVAAGTAMMGGAPASARFRDGHREKPDKGHEQGRGHDEGSLIRRSMDVFQAKLKAARHYLTARPASQPTNGDEARYADFRASFTKCFPHNDIGEVETSAYRTLLRALNTQRDSDFDRLSLDQTVRTRRLVNPQGAYAMPLAGPDGQQLRMPAAPSFTGDETAAEMLELYWKALLRDIPFSQLETHPFMRRALSDINSFPHVVGRLGRRPHTAQTLFRGETSGDLTGPYVSQFLWHDIPYGAFTMAQRYRSVAPDVNFMADTHEWLTVQRGGVLRQGLPGTEHYIANGRDLAAFVHSDFPFQAYLNAALILFGMGGDVIDQGNPTHSQTTQDVFVSFGGPDVLDMVTMAARAALTGAWCQKWMVHRRLRPEAYGGRLHMQAAGRRDYDLPKLLLETEALKLTSRKQSTHLLSQCYPEGSPTHPSYPAGHACIAGACATVLKAWFREDALIPNPVVANQTGSALQSYSGALTVGGEINKLAANISLGRDWAGVHYRSDGIEGMNLGEAMAIDLLRDRSVLYNERFNGFTLTKFSGQTVRIRNGEVYPASV